MRPICAVTFTYSHTLATICHVDCYKYRLAMINADMFPESINRNVSYLCALPVHQSYYLRLWSQLMATRCH
jgi:hypothetical protein